MDSNHLCAKHARGIRNYVARANSLTQAQQQQQEQPQPQPQQQPQQEQQQQQLQPQPQDDKWRRHCGCIRTSEKLKEVLKAFPAAPPPTPLYEQNCITATAYCTANPHFPFIRVHEREYIETDRDVGYTESKASNKSWQILGDLVHLVQLSVTATALALYYVIYCYMQLIYYTLRSALYFHNADGPMKITIGVVTLTSVIVGFNLIIRMEKMIGIYLF
ncbi:hypothetical protein ABMA27_003901 [Loxostege sticticalis]|uniref:Uncharacterized protein n=1 Tax=Loxostege sticticalis TaxID=481309 RepID=A0ABR3HQS1_LOXSC